MTLQVARITATTAAVAYGTVQVSRVAVAAESAAVTPSKVQVSKVSVAAIGVLLPPMANAGAAQTWDAGQTVTLAGTDDAPDSTVTARAWRVTAGSVPLIGASTAMATFTAPPLLADQTYTFAYKVTSGNGLTAEATVTHTILAATERVMRNGVEVPIYFL